MENQGQRSEQVLFFWGPGRRLVTLHKPLSPRPSRTAVLFLKSEREGEATFGRNEGAPGSRVGAASSEGLVGGWASPDDAERGEHQGEEAEGGDADEEGQQEDVVAGTGETWREGRAGRRGGGAGGGGRQGTGRSSPSSL